MRAKDYLMQLENLNADINSMYASLREMRAKIEDLGSLDYSKDKVMSSAQNTMEDRIIKYVDDKNEIEKMVDMYIDLQRRIQKEISSLGTSTYIEILTKRYIERKGLIQISEEMNYSYDRIRHLHGEALWAFEEKYFRS